MPMLVRCRRMLSAVAKFLLSRASARMACAVLKRAVPIASSARLVPGYALRSRRGSRTLRATMAISASGSAMAVVRGTDNLARPRMARSASRATARQPRAAEPAFAAMPTAARLLVHFAVAPAAAARNARTIRSAATVATWRRAYAMRCCRSAVSAAAAVNAGTAARVSRTSAGRVAAASATARSRGRGATRLGGAWIRIRWCAVATSIAR